MVEFKGFKVVKDGWDNRIASISDGEREREDGKWRRSRSHSASHPQ